MTLTTLVSGRPARAREAAIWSALQQEAAAAGHTALILEGLADGKLAEADLPPELEVKRIAPGCFCCIGNLTLRVTLNRLLRKAPARLFISIADDTHLPQIRAFLSLPPYDAYLTLTPDLTV